MKTILLITTLLYSSIAVSQSIYKSSISSGGDISSNGTIQLLYAIGEVNVQELSVTGIIVSEGFVSIEAVDNPLGSDLYPELSGVLVYPNPTTKNIVISGLTETARITIYDVKGSLVLERKGYVANNPINIDHLSSGHYVLKIFNQNGISLKKIVKQ